MNFDLQAKLVFGFIVVAGICALVGAVGWFGISSIKSDLEVTGGEYVPALEAVLTLEATQAQVKASTRTLLNPALSLEAREAEYTAIDEAMGEATGAISRYEGLQLDSDERSLWLEFKSSRKKPYG